MPTTTTPQTPRELAHRQNDGVDVLLFWDPADDALLLTVTDARSGEVLEFPVQRDRALDAFHHPYAYAA
jgi:hypothetical protein